VNAWCSTVHWLSSILTFIQVLSSVWPSHLDQDKRSMKQMRIKQKSKFLCVFLSVLPKIMMFIIGVMETFGGCGPPCGENVRSPVVMCRPPWWFMEVGPADQSVTINSGVGSIFNGGVKWAFATTSAILPMFFLNSTFYFYVHLGYFGAEMMPPSLLLFLFLFVLIVN